MANIVFNRKQYSIEQSIINAMINNLKNYITTNMAGTGASIQLDGQTYQISSTKYSGIVSNFVSHLGTITGDGKVKVIVNGTTYSIDSGSMNNAIVNIEDALEEVASSIVDVVSYTNQVPLSTESGGKTIYNGGLGYKNGYRIRSGGAEGALDSSAHTGFIPVKAGDIVRIGGLDFGSTHSHGSALNVANSSFTNIGQFSMTAGEYGIFLESAYRAYSVASVVQEKTGVWKWVVPPAASGVAYIRVSANTYPTSSGVYPAADGSKLIVTINEEIE